MNKSRRVRVEKVLGQLRDYARELEAIIIEEQEAHDNLPESLQSGEQGERMDAGITTLTDLMDSIDSGCDDVEGEIGL